MITVNPSVTGATSHTPVIPKKCGRTSNAINRMTSPRAMEITADSFANPMDV